MASNRRVLRWQLAFLMPKDWELDKNPHLLDRCSPWAEMKKRYFASRR